MQRKHLLALCLLLALATPGWGGAEFYCCNDQTTGRRVCGDSLPQQCRGKAYRIFDKAGNLQKEVGPPLTPEQKEVIREQARRAKEIEEAQREQRRLDQALLDTYATPEDIERAQSKAENDVKLLIQMAQEKILASQKQQRKLAAEAEFYKRLPMPADLEKNLRNVGHEIQLQQEFIELKNKDLATLHAKYDTERRRYFELTGRSTKTPRPAQPAAATPRVSPSASR